MILYHTSYTEIGELREKKPNHQICIAHATFRLLGRHLEHSVSPNTGISTPLFSWMVCIFVFKPSAIHILLRNK